MSTLGLFAMGAFMTLLVTAGLGLLVYGAILDGRDEARRKAEAAHRPPPLVVGGRSPAA